MGDTSRDSLIPAQPNRRFARFFDLYVSRLLRRRFCAVRLADDGARELDEMGAASGPAIVVFNHSSWWDPLIGFWLSRRLTPGRPCFGPMDRRELERFGMLRKIGCFGIDPDDGASLRPMLRYTRRMWEQEDPRAVLWMTPQGDFFDVRESIVVRPGVAAVAAAYEEILVASLAIELVFWQDQRPEILLRLTSVRGADRSARGWQESIERAMRSNAAALGELAMARDPAAFRTLLGGDARINPVYDAWLRLRGRGGTIRSRRTGPDAAPSAEHA